MAENMRTSNYVIYISLPEDDTRYIVHGYTGAADKVSAGTVQYLLDRMGPGPRSHTQDEEIARESVRGRETVPPTPETVETLVRRGYLTERSPDEEREYIRQVFSFFYRRAVARAKPAFLFVPTYQCNMRCPYCYEAPSRSDLQKQHCIDEIMTREMADAAFRAMDVLITGSLKEPQTLAEAKRGAKVTLYGGEPLMRETAGIVDYLFHTLTEQGMRLDAITNAVELDQFAPLLGPSRLEFIQVTLDGPRDVHNSKRRGPRYPEGTYDRILSNIELALERQVNVSLRVHLAKEHAQRAGEVMEDLDSRGLLASKLLNVYASPLHNFSRGYKPESYQLMLLHEAQDALEACSPTAQSGRTLRVIESQVGAKLRSCLQQSVAGLGQNPMFCGSQVGFYIFDPFGGVYKCWEDVGNPRLRVGSYFPDGLELNEREDEWRGRSAADIPECADCKYLFFHAGGCALAAPRSERGLMVPGCFDFEADFVTFGRKFFQTLETNPAVVDKSELEKGGEIVVQQGH
jgi:uncharacterized protein